MDDKGATDFDRSENGTGSARRELLYAHLMILMQLADDSAALAYPRRLHMPNISRQLIFMIGMYGTIASKDLALASGREKAQISRGIKALAEHGLVDRGRTRRAIRLTEAGRAIFLDIMKIARERDDMLREGLADDAVARFLEMTATLIDRASSIFVADERLAAIDLEERSSEHHPPVPRADLPRAGREDASYRDLILPWLQSLTIYMRRSGTTLFRREVGLSNFEYRVLSLIEENQPTNLSGLIAFLSRDKSQVARVIKQLHAAGLIDRHDQGRINAALSLTAAGRARYRKIVDISAERDRVLFGAHTPEERAFYLGVMEKLTANASALLEREMRARDGKKQAPRDDAPDVPDTEDASSDADIPALHAELRLLRDENARLKRLLAEAILEKSLLQDRASQNA